MFWRETGAYEEEEEVEARDIRDWGCSIIASECDLLTPEPILTNQAEGVFIGVGFRRCRRACASDVRRVRGAIAAGPRFCQPSKWEKESRVVVDEEG